MYSGIVSVNGATVTSNSLPWGLSMVPGTKENAPHIEPGKLLPLVQDWYSKGLQQGNILTKSNPITIQIE